MTKKESELQALIDQADAAAEEALDLSDITEEGPGALAAGEYLVGVKKATIGKVKSEGENNGKPKITLELKPLDPPSTKLVFFHGQITGPTAGKTKSLLSTLGADTSGPLKVHELVGLTAYITVTVQKDNARFNNIDDWRPSDDDVNEEAEALR